MNRVKWITKGDRNSTFFYFTTNVRRKRNRITRIENNRGEWKDTKRGIKYEISEHFRSVFRAEGEDLVDIEILGVILR